MLIYVKNVLILVKIKRKKVTAYINQTIELEISDIELIEKSFICFLLHCIAPYNYYYYYINNNTKVLNIN